MTKFMLLAGLVVSLARAPLAAAQPSDADLVAQARAQYQVEKAARATKLKARVAPYKEAGVAGDKLALVRESYRRDIAIFGKGGAELTTPAAVRDATVMFWLEGAPGEEWTLHRFAFSGNHRVTSTAEGYVVRPGPSKFR